MPQLLKELIERGLAPENYQDPMRLWRMGNGRTLHGHKSCKAQDGEPTLVMANPAQAQSLCSCWSLVLPTNVSPEVADDYYTAEILGTIHDRTQGPFATPLAQLQVLRRHEETLLTLEAGAGVRDWHQRLQRETREAIVLLEATFTDPSTRLRLRAWCIENGYGWHQDLLSDDDGHVIAGQRPSLARKAEHDLWGRYIELQKKNATNEDIEQAFHQVILKHVDWNVSVLQLNFHPSSSPEPGESLRDYVLREWHHDLQVIAHDLVQDWNRLWHDQDGDLLVFGISPRANLPVIKGELIEAWRIGEKDDHVLMAAPRYALEALGGHMMGTLENVCALTEADTPSVLETFLNFWTPLDSSNPFWDVPTALEAARRV